MTIRVPSLKVAGFTLLEMLFVMFIVGLMVALTVPRYGASIDQLRLNSQRQEMEDQLRQLPRRVRMLARSIELPRDLSLKSLGDGDAALRIAEDWAVSFSPPLIISTSGACSATVVSLTSRIQTSASRQYQIAELTCELSALRP